MAESKHSFLGIHDSIPTWELQEMAQKHLGETEELKEDCLKQLRILIKEHKVPCVSTDDFFLLRFLRFKKFDTKRSFEALRNYVHQTKDLHKHLLKLRPEILETCLNLNIFGILPYRDAEGRLICFFRPDIWNPEICSIDECYTVGFLLSKFVSEKVTSQISGTVFLLVSESLPLTYIFYAMRILNRSRNFLLNCVPTRYTRLHVIFDSAVFRYFFALLSPAVPKKIVQRVQFHEEFGENIFKDVPRSILPDEFGGTMGPLNADHLKDVLMDYLKKEKEEHRLYTSV